MTMIKQRERGLSKAGRRVLRHVLTVLRTDGVFKQTPKEVSVKLTMKLRTVEDAFKQLRDRQILIPTPRRTTSEPRKPGHLLATEYRAAVPAYADEMMPVELFNELVAAAKSNGINQVSDTAVSTYTVPVLDASATEESVVSAPQISDTTVLTDNVCHLPQVQPNQSSLRPITTQPVATSPIVQQSTVKTVVSQKVSTCVCGKPAETRGWYEWRGFCSSKCMDGAR